MRAATKPSAQKATQSLLVHHLRVRPTSDLELEWFFNAVECDMGLRSNWYLALGPDCPTAVEGTPEDFVEAAHVERLIRGWLRALPDPEAGVLQAAYETRLWPRRLRDDLGTLTGVVVRLTCALDPWPDDPQSRSLVEMTRAGWLDSECEQYGAASVLAELRRAAEVRFGRAIRAYESIRGMGPCLVRAS